MNHLEDNSNMLLMNDENGLFYIQNVGRNVIR